jgi:hypothetical protein
MIFEDQLSEEILQTYRNNESRNTNGMMTIQQRKAMVRSANQGNRTGGYRNLGPFAANGGIMGQSQK